MTPMQTALKDPTVCNFSEKKDFKKIALGGM